MRSLFRKDHSMWCGQHRGQEKEETPEKGHPELRALVTLRDTMMVRQGVRRAWGKGQPVSNRDSDK